MMKILLITDEVWNDKIHGNNILTNWFEGMDVEIANIYCSSGLPDNKCCKKYFQITDAMMVRSFFGEKAGKGFELQNDDERVNYGEEENKKFYSFMKSITTESLRSVREWIWMHGRYNESELRSFIKQFGPDIIFSPRYATRKIMRLERLVHEISNAPFVAFTADDEYSLRQLRVSPIYWIRRLLSRKDLKRNVKIYAKYFTFSEEQASFYSKEFGIETECLYKNGAFLEKYEEKEIHSPIRIIYGGKLYCNRYKVLAKIGKALSQINKGETKAVLEIYTKDTISARRNKMLNDGKNIFVKGSVSAERLSEIYQDADIALHVESQDIKNRLLTRYSFSTKIIDCLASGCAVVAVCWSEQSGFKYLQKEDAAICIGDETKIREIFEKIIFNPDIIKEYQKKAWKCGQNNHEKKIQKEKLLEEFTKIIEGI